MRANPNKGVKIPAFLSKALNSLETKEERDVFVDGYKHWKKSEFTEALIEFLGKKLDDTIRDEETRKDFISLFQSKYNRAHNLGYRESLRETIKQLK